MVVDLALTEYACNARLAHIWNHLMALAFDANKAALHALVSKLVQYMKKV